MRHFPAALTARESDEMVERIIAGWARGFGLWAVERLDNHEFIGYVGFSQPRFEAHFTLRFNLSRYSPGSSVSKT